MNEDTVTRVQRSFRSLRSQRDVLGERFTRRLFAENPQMRPLFPANMEGWHYQFGAMLDKTVRLLHRPESVRRMIPDMPIRRLGQTAAMQHFAIATDTLVRVIAELQDQQWSAELDRAWRSVLAGVTQRLADQCAEAPDSPRADKEIRTPDASPGLDAGIERAQESS